jgi:hypothetical protein
MLPGNVPGNATQGVTKPRDHVTLSHMMSHIERLFKNAPRVILPLLLALRLVSRINTYIDSNPLTGNPPEPGHTLYY